MPSPAITAIPLTIQEQVRTKCTHVQPVKYTDLNDTAGTTKTLSIFTGRSKQGIGRVFFVIDTNFDGGSTTDLTVAATLNYASSTDKALLSAVSIHEDGTEVPASPAGIGVVDASTTDTTFGQQELDVLNSLRTIVNQLTGRTPIVASEGWTLDLLFTSTTANLDALTSGKLLVFFEVIDLTGFAQVA